MLHQQTALALGLQLKLREGGWVGRVPPARAGRTQLEVLLGPLTRP